MADTLKESIEKAADEQESSNQVKTIPENPKPSNPDESEDDESEDSEEPEQDDPARNKKSEDDVVPDEETQEIETAVALLRALRDPSQSKGIIQDLALRVGLIAPGEQVTKSDEKDLKSVLKETLADEYPDLKDKLEAILGKIQEDSDRKIEQLKQEIAQRDQRNAEKEFSIELDTFFRENKISEKEAELMIKEIHLVPPGPKISLKNYLSKIHTLVKVGKSSELKTVDRINRINANRKESSVRNLSSDVDDKRISKGSQFPSIKEAISMAMEEATQKR